MVIIMKEIIIRDMSFSYKEKKIFSLVNLDIEDASFVTVLGHSGSGKTTLAKILALLLPFEGYINMNRTVLSKENKSSLHRKISYISENFYNEFLCETVLDEIVYTVENMGYGKEEMQKRAFEIASLLRLEYDLEKTPNELSISKKALLKLASSLISKPKILIIDSLLCYMNTDDRKRAIKVLQKYNKENKMIVFLITNEVEDVFWGTDVLLVSPFPTHFLVEDIYHHEKDFQKALVPLPFMVSLSKKLSYYSLVDHCILDKKEMVQTLWK